MIWRKRPRISNVAPRWDMSRGLYLFISQGEFDGPITKPGNPV